MTSRWPLGTALFLAFSLSAFAQNIPVKPRVAIIGAGISGLSAAHELRRYGDAVDVQIYESTAIPGGRIRTIPNINGTDLYMNGGAELVDSTHTELMRIMNDLDIPLVSRVLPDHPEDTMFMMDGKVYKTEEEIMGMLFQKHELSIRRLQADAEKLKRSSQGLPSGAHSAFKRSIDSMTVEQYLKSQNIQGELYSYLKMCLESEVGGQINKITALKVFDNFGFDSQAKAIKFLPENDELYRVRGGTQKIIDALYSENRKEVTLNHKLTSVQSADGKMFTLRFETPQGQVSQTVDHLIITSPLSDVRKMELNVAGLPKAMKKVIKETTYSTNQKLSLIFDKRVWNDLGKSGYALSDRGYQLWDSSLNQPGTKTGMLTAYLGDNPELKRLGKEEFAKLVLSDLEKLYPGISAHYKSYHLETWPVSYSGGSKPGELTSLDMSAHNYRNLHLAGETFGTTSREYMNGAVQAADTAVAKIAAGLKLSCSADYVVTKLLLAE